MPPVFSVTSDQLNLWMVAFLWPFVRMLALISTAPIFSEAAVPRAAKVGLAALLAIVVAPTLGVMPAVPLVSAAGFWILIQQVLIGAAMGFSMRMVFAAGGEVFSGGLMLALPLIATLLTLNLAMGILNRVSPQFSIFAVGFPITLLAGMAMLQLLMQYLAPFLEPRFAAGFTTTLGFLQGLSP